MPDNFTQKEMLISLMRDVREVRDTQMEHTSNLTSIEKQTTDTNGRVARVIKELAALETIVYEEDRKVTIKLLKYGSYALVFTAFVFIKESRDVMISFLSKLIGI